MDQSTSTVVTSGNITSSSTIVTSTPSNKSSVIVDPSSSDEKQSLTSALLTTYTSTATDLQNTPKRVSSSSTISSPLLTPPTGKILSRNCNGTSE